MWKPLPEARVPMAARVSIPERAERRPTNPDHDGRLGTKFSIVPATPRHHLHVAGNAAGGTGVGRIPWAQVADLGKRRIPFQRQRQHHAARSRRPRFSYRCAAHVRTHMATTERRADGALSRGRQRTASFYHAQRRDSQPGKELRAQYELAANGYAVDSRRLPP